MTELKTPPPLPLYDDDRSIGHSTFAVHNPATGAKLAELPISSADEVALAVGRARRAQSGWAALSHKERARLLYGWRSRLMANRGGIVDTLVSETGKPRQEALLELLYIADLIGYYCSNAPKFLKDRQISLHLLKNKRALVAYQPLGVVGVISPWNFPLILSFGDSIAALVAGNGVVIKPSEVTPLTALLVAELAEAGDFPAGLIEVVTGLGETGAALIDQADLIAFTGGTATGKKVMERASRRLVPVLLELGSKDPMIVLKDANLERAVNGAVTGAFFNAGQVCISVERVYVEEPIYDRFVSRVVEEVNKLRVGRDPDGQHNIDVGPMTFLPQLEKVERQIEDARQKGATILTGGQRQGDGPGQFYAPTVLTDVRDDMLVMQEETFGPVLPIIKVKDAQEALRRANASRFGLSSSIWTGDATRGAALARQIEAGSTCVNDVLINYTMPEVPFGGIKESGIGYRHGGPEALQKFSRAHSIIIDRFGLRRELNWMPYSKRTNQMLEGAMKLLFRRSK